MNSDEFPKEVKTYHVTPESAALIVEAVHLHSIDMKHFGELAQVYCGMAQTSYLPYTMVKMIITVMVEPVGEKL